MNDAVEIRLLSAADAEKLADCFRRCYGDSYAVSFFYDPAEIRSRLVDRRLESFVAVAGDGEIVGHMGLQRRYPDALTVELGNAIVDPRYRRHGLLSQLGGRLVELARSVGAVGYHHVQTTAHEIIQRAAGEVGGVETGVMLAYIPAGTEYRDLVAGAPQGRLAAVTVYQALVPAPPRDVAVPRRYAALLRTIYARARLERRSIESRYDDRGTVTALAAEAEPRRALLRIDVEKVGADVGARVDSLERTHANDVTHVDLPLSDPAVEDAVESLRAKGFFFCALLPEYAPGDVLRLQRLRTASWVRPKLVVSQARELLATVLHDREATAIAST